jgi:predicted component of type VI protein secretion system
MKYVVVLLFLAGCSAAPQSINANKTERLSLTVAGAVRIYTDPETKCQYLILAGTASSGFTPRLGADNKIICN